MTPPDDGSLDAELTALHDAYVWRINEAVSAGRDDVAWTLSQEFPDEALKVLVRAHQRNG